MKIPTLLLTLLYALDLGVTAVSVESHEIARRLPPTAPTLPSPTPVKEKNYLAIEKLHSPLVTGVTYKFTQTNPLNPSEKDVKAKALADKLGYSHIYLVVGNVITTSKITTLGPRKGQVITTYDFQAKEYDMVIDSKDKTNTKVALGLMRNWDINYARSKTLKYVGTTKKSHDDIKSHGKSIHPYFRDIISSSRF